MNSDRKERYKPAKTVDQMTEYLHDNKRVVYNEISEQKAQEILLRYNYINVITPFKHVFAKVDKKGMVIKENNRHIYEREVDFKEYYDCYSNERAQYPALIKSILEFEAHLNTLVSYEILVDTDSPITDSDALIEYIRSLQLGLLNSNSYSERIPHMEVHLSELLKRVHAYHDVYCFFDRVSMGQLLTLFITLPERKQIFIINKLKEFDWDLGVSQVSHFVKKVSMIIEIRNTLMHYNSLTVLIRFYNAKKHDYRKTSDKKAHENMINYLAKKNHSFL